LKHFRRILAFGHLLNRLAHRFDAFAAAIQPGVCQRVHVGEQFGMRREPQIRIVGEDLAEGVAQREL
jgi:hypothetical protein